MPPVCQSEGSSCSDSLGSGARQHRFRRTGRHLSRLRAPLMDWTHQLRTSLHKLLKGPHGPERWNRALPRLFMLAVRYMGAWALLSGAGDSTVNGAFRTSRLSQRGGGPHMATPTASDYPITWLQLLWAAKPREELHNSTVYRIDSKAGPWPVLWRSRSLIAPSNSSPAPQRP